MQPDDSERLDALTNALNELRQKQERLEERLARLEKPAAAASQEPVARDPIQPAPEPVQIPAETSTLESQVGLTIVNRIGAVTLVLGVAFFFKWAVDNNWIGPLGRVVLGLLAGFVTLAVGEFIFRRRHRVFAQGITASAIAILFLTIYAAFNFYHLIPQPAAFLMMAAATVLAAALALRYGSVAIAVLGWVAGYATPLLLSNGEDHPWFLFSYLLLLNGAATELAARRKWPALEIVSFAGSLIVYGGWLLHGGTKEGTRLVATLAPLAFCAERWRTQTPLLFAISQFLTALALTLIWQTKETAYLPLQLLLAGAALLFAGRRNYPIALLSAFVGFWLADALQEAPFFAATCGFLLFFAWSWWHLLWKHSAASTVALSIFALNGAVYFAHSYLLLPGDRRPWLALLALLIAAAYLVLGILLHKAAQSNGDTRPSLLALGMASAFLTLAIPIQLIGFTITIAWAMQGAALAWIGYRFASARALYAALLVFALVAVRLLLFEVASLPDPHSYSAIANTRFLTFGLSALAMLLAAWWAARISRIAALAAYFAGHAFLLLGLCLEIAGWARRAVSAENRLSAETIGISILFALYAVALVSVGVATRTIVNRVSGLALTAIVILKLYVFDVWQLTRPYRILAFVILGILLLATSFLYSNFRRLIGSLCKDGKTFADR